MFIRSRDQCIFASFIFILQDYQEGKKKIMLKAAWPWKLLNHSIVAWRALQGAHKDFFILECKKKNKKNTEINVSLK